MSLMKRANRFLTCCMSSTGQTKAPASWQAEKDQLVMKHYEEKSHYIHEIQLLRKSLSPDKEQILRDLRQVQQSRDSLETEVIHTQSRNDELRVSAAKTSANIIVLFSHQPYCFLPRTG